MPELIYGKVRITYEVVISLRRATVGITVYPDKRVVVHAPRKSAPTWLQQVVQKKAPWILKQLSQIEANPRGRKEFVSGEGFSFLGQTYPLEVLLDDLPGPAAELAADKLVVLLPRDLCQEQHTQNVRIALEQWYWARAKEVLPSRVGEFSLLFGHEPVKVAVRNQLHRWGSCSSNGNINLSWRVVMAPLWVVDYVAAHEVCHLEVPNHSTAFWHRLGTVLPDYQAPRDWLKVNGHRLAF